MKKILLSITLVLSFMSINAQNWIQLGNGIAPEESGDRWGHSATTSADGNTVACSAHWNGVGDEGHVRVFEWNGSAWVQKGGEINGEGGGDNSGQGQGVSLSDDGNVVAIGSRWNDNFNGSNSGHVRVYEWDGLAWVQKGGDIDGEDANNWSGRSISINSNGNVLAIGASGGNGSTGQVRIYEWNGIAWVQRGVDIHGSNVNDGFGYSVGIDSAGVSCVIGANYNLMQSGQVRVYDWDGFTWIQKGVDIQGENVNDESGQSVSINATGDVIAVGAAKNDGNGAEAGQVRVFEWDGLAWVQRGIDIDGVTAGDYFGYSISLSSDGNKLAAGTYNLSSGYVQVFDWSGTAWIQSGMNLTGGGGNYFGWSVSLNSLGTRLAVGSPVNNGELKIFSIGSACTTIQSINNINICNGNSYYAEGANQTVSGIYYDTLPAITGCDSVITTNLVVSPQIIITPSISNDNGSGIGIIDISVSGGSSPYSYSWSNGSITEGLINLTSGSYSVEVTDSIGCTANETVNIINSCSMNLTINSIGTSCGQNDGATSVSLTGGTPPYNYEWSNGATTSLIATLDAGLYYVTVTDDNGCIEYGTATVNDSPGATISIATTPTSCFGGADGAIDAAISGGTTPYTFAWSNGEATEDITGLVAGQYQLQVTDADGCITNDNITITAATALEITTTVTNSSCGGNTDGAITSTVTGGTGAYTYFWSTTATTADINGLVAGVYMLTVTDANGCMDSTSVSVNEENGPVVHLDSVVSASCGGLGSAYVSAYGNAPFTYAWSNSEVTQDLIDVIPGTYQLEVTAAGGCVSNLSVVIGNDMPVVQDICIVTVDSATNTNTVVWEKPITTAIESFNVYKESTVANQYFLAGNVPYDSLSQFNDPNSNPNQRAWRYRLTSVDTCNVESEMGTIHKTIHLTVSLGQGNDYNLAWNHYEGFTYGSYYISRWSPSTGWVNIDTIPSNLNTYTDFSQPQGNVFYSIEAEHPTGCTSTKAQDHNSTRSNRHTSIGGAAPSSDFSSSGTQIVSGSSIDFFDQSINNPTTWSWNLYGANPSTSTDQNPTNITYGSTGFYDVRLIVSNANGIDTLVKTNYIEVIAPGGAAPTSDFIASTTQIQEGSSVDFLDQSQNNPTSWTWVFDGGNPAFSTNQSPTGVLYNAAGSYDVTLIASNSFGVDTLVKTTYINVATSNSINENGLGNLTIFPNPTSDQITIDIKGYNGVVNVEVYDLQGRLLETTTNTTVSLKKHAKGIYVLKVSYGEVTEEFRVVRH